VAAPSASIAEHVKTGLQELTRRQHDLDEQLSRIEILQLEKQAVAKRIGAVSATLQAFA
jgi:hypothetical protein